MSDVVRLDALCEDDRDAIAACPECGLTGAGTVVLCGWHESYLAAIRAVRRMLNSVLDES